MTSLQEANNVLNKSLVDSICEAFICSATRNRESRLGVSAAEVRAHGARMRDSSRTPAKDALVVGPLGGHQRPLRWPPVASPAAPPPRTFQHSSSGWFSMRRIPRAWRTLPAFLATRWVCRWRCWTGLLKYGTILGSRQWILGFGRWATNHWPTPFLPRVLNLLSSRRMPY